MARESGDLLLMSNSSRFIEVSLVGLIVGLLAIGVVSGTPVRHIIQVLPATFALSLVIKRVPWAFYAALPVFVFWLLIMLAIWLFLLGLATIVTGHFSSVEIALTFVVGASCLCGLSHAFRTQPVASRLKRAAWAIVFTILQVGALWASLRPAFAHT
jgi:hypothetical protein